MKLTGVKIAGSPEVAESIMGEVKQAVARHDIAHALGVGSPHSTVIHENGAVTTIAETPFGRAVFVDVRGVTPSEKQSEGAASESSRFEVLYALLDYAHKDTVTWYRVKNGELFPVEVNGSIGIGWTIDATWGDTGDTVSFPSHGIGGVHGRFIATGAEKKANGERVATIVKTGRGVAVVTLPDVNETWYDVKIPGDVRVSVHIGGVTETTVLSVNWDQEGDDVPANVATSWKDFLENLGGTLAIEDVSPDGSKLILSLWFPNFSDGMTTHNRGIRCGFYLLEFNEDLTPSLSVLKNRKATWLIERSDLSASATATNWYLCCTSENGATSGVMAGEYDYRAASAYAPAPTMIDGLYVWTYGSTRIHPERSYSLAAHCIYTVTVGAFFAADNTITYADYRHEAILNASFSYAAPVTEGLVAESLNVTLDRAETATETARISTRVGGVTIDELYIHSTGERSSHIEQRELAGGNAITLIDVSVSTNTGITTVTDEISGGTIVSKDLGGARRVVNLFNYTEPGSLDFAPGEPVITAGEMYASTISGAPCGYFYPGTNGGVEYPVHYFSFQPGVRYGNRQFGARIVVDTYSGVHSTFDAWGLWNTEDVYLKQYRTFRVDGADPKIDAGFERNVRETPVASWSADNMPFAPSLWAAASTPRNFGTSLPFVENAQHWGSVQAKKWVCGVFDTSGGKAVPVVGFFNKFTRTAAL